jgi:hypothetical protein
MHSCRHDTNLISIDPWFHDHYLLTYGLRISNYCISAINDKILTRDIYSCV